MILTNMGAISVDINGNQFQNTFQNVIEYEIEESLNSVFAEAPAPYGVPTCQGSGIIGERRITCEDIPPSVV